MHRHKRWKACLKKKSASRVRLHHECLRNLICPCMMLVSLYYVKTYTGWDARFLGGRSEFQLYKLFGEAEIISSSANCYLLSELDAMPHSFHLKYLLTSSAYRNDMALNGYVRQILWHNMWQHKLHLWVIVVRTLFIHLLFLARVVFFWPWSCFSMNCCQML